MFIFLLTIAAWRHSMPIMPKQTINLIEELKTKDANLNIILEVLPSENYSPEALTYKLVGPELNIQKTFTGTKTELKYSKMGYYDIFITNTGGSECYFSINTYTDSYTPDEDHLHIKKITNKLRADLSNIYSENLNLKELKEINLRALRKDRKWMMTLIMLPIFYIIVGFVCLRIQKGFFTPKKR